MAAVVTTKPDDVTEGDEAHVDRPHWAGGNDSPAALRGGIDISAHPRSLVTRPRSVLVEMTIDWSFDGVRTPPQDQSIVIAEGAAPSATSNGPE